MTAPRVLLTGAAGVVGQAIAEALRELSLTCLLRTGDPELPPGAVRLRGDIAADDLGLDPADYKRLATGTDVIVHSAARTDWGLPAAEYQAVNVAGARRVAELAERAEAAVVFLSTAFVPAVDPANPAPISANNVVRTYLESKRVAEEVFRSGSRPSTIVRPTNLVGHAKTGASAHKQIVQHIAEWIVRGRLPFFPATPGNRLDILPVNTVAEAVAGCIAEGTYGDELWLTAGDRALSVDEGLAVCIEVGRARGLKARPIDIIDPRTAELAQRLAGLAPPVAQVLRVAADVSAVISACGGVLPSSMDDLVTRFGMEHPDLAVAMRRSLEYWSPEGRAR